MTDRLSKVIVEVRCQSGLRGWRTRLQKNYASLAEFVSYARIFSLHERLGYETPTEAWKANPVIEGSVKPSDFRKVRD